MIPITRNQLSASVVALFVVVAIFFSGCRKQNDPPSDTGPAATEGEKNGPKKKDAAGPMARYAGEWTDQWHHFTIEADGLGYGSTDFGSAYGTAEFRIREEGGQASAEIPHPGLRDRGTRLFDLRLKGTDTLELFERGGQATYVLKKLGPRAPTKVGDVAGSWKAWEVRANGRNPDTVLKLQGLVVSLNSDGQGMWQVGDNPPNKLEVQGAEQGFTLAGPEGTQWELGRIHLSGEGITLRLKSADGAVRVYLAKNVAAKNKGE